MSKVRWIRSGVSAMPPTPRSRKWETSATDHTIDGLGTENYGIRVDFFSPATGPDVGILHTWRVDNLILRLVVFGDGVEDAEVRALIDVVLTKFET